MLNYILIAILSMMTANFEQSYNKIGYVQKGRASYYAEDFHGKKTANGEIFNMNALTAAHPRIRFGTTLKVTNQETGLSVLVRVNDRGPYVGGRILDLSKEAAKKIGMIKNGTADITMEVVATEKIPTIEEITKRKEEEKKKSPDFDKELEKEWENKAKKKNKVLTFLEKLRNALRSKENKVDEPIKEEKNEPKQTSNNEPQEELPIRKNPIKKEPIKVTPKDTPTEELPEPKRNPKVDSKSTSDNIPITKPNPINEAGFEPLNTYNIWGTEKFPDGHGVQVGAYSDFQKMMEIAKQLQKLNLAHVYIQVEEKSGKKVYRIIVGEGEPAKAANLVPTIKEQGYSGVFVKQHY